MIEYFDQPLKSAVVVSKSEWKIMVNGCDKEKEGREWIATSMMYKTLQLTKWDCGILWKVKVMFKLIITNNIKCGSICDCEAHTVEHILFQCKNVKQICRILWQKVRENANTNDRRI